MSYDVALENRDGEIPGTYASITYNVSPMFRMAFGSDGKVGGIYRLHGLTGNMAAGLIEDAIADMESRPDEYRALNPENGWGSAEGTAQFLRSLLRDCRYYSRAKVSVS